MVHLQVLRAKRRRGGALSQILVEYTQSGDKKSTFQVKRRAFLTKIVSPPNSFFRDN
jgi:hypothetical protein